MAPSPGAVSKSSDNEYEPAVKDIEPNQISEGHRYIEFAQYVISSSLDNETVPIPAVLIHHLTDTSHPSDIHSFSTFS